MCGICGIINLKNKLVRYLIFDFKVNISLFYVMDLKLLYSLMTVFIFCPTTKSYSKREIHPLEPMFTYDYALKYYGNIRAIKKSRIHKAPQYKALENFTAPKGVSSIEHYVPRQDAYFNCEGYRPYGTLPYPVKTCYYDIETGFLTKEVYKSTDEEGKVKEAVYTYNYIDLSI